MLKIDQKEEEMRVPLFRIFWDDEDIESVTNVVKRGSHWAVGPEIAQFERELAAHHIGANQEVIVPSFSFISTANAALFVGAKPVFADIETTTFGLDPHDVIEKITPRTKAIIPVHYGGCPCRINELREIAQDNDLLLIEDTAESLGAHIDSQMAGSFGNSAILSFCQNKIITTGEGGAVVTDSEDVYRRLLLFRSHGREESQDYFITNRNFEYISLGYNMRMATMLAALGLTQLRKISDIIAKRRECAQYLIKTIREIPGISIPIPPRNYHHVYQMFTIRVDEEIRDDMMDYLEGKGISTKVFFYPIHKTRFFRELFGFRGGELPITEKISRGVISLPIYPSLSTEEMDHVCRALKEYGRYP
jgi:perosamine synthetase